MRVLIPLAVALLAVVGFSFRLFRNRNGVDAGTVSEGWLAEQRADSYDPGR